MSSNSAVVHVDDVPSHFVDDQHDSIQINQPMSLSMFTASQDMKTPPVMSDKLMASFEILAAASHNDLVPEMLIPRLALKPNLSFIDESGNSALNWAVRWNNLECVKLLIAAGGVDVNAMNGRGFTSLHCAAFYGQVDCIPILLAAGANLEAPSKDGATPIYFAIQQCHSECVQKMLELGASVWSECELGLTTPMSRGLASAIDDCDNSASDDEKAKTLNLLLQHPSNEDGVTALMGAASYGCVKCVTRLLKLGLDPDAEDKYGITALMVAMLPSGDERDLNELSNKSACIQALRGNRTDAELQEMYQALRE